MLNDKQLKWVHEVKHLGNWLCSDLSDLIDINKKKGKMVSDINKLVNKFKGSKYNVKCNLLRSYCTSFYGSQCWNLNDKNIGSLLTMWNRGVRKLFQLPFITHCFFNTFYI